MKIAMVVSVGGLLLAGIGLHLDWYALPERLNPFAPLRLEDEPNLLTGFKTARARADDGLCREALATSAFRYTPLTDRSTAPGCGFDNAVMVARTGVQLSAPAPMSCRNALSLALWERHVVQPAALATLGQPLRRIDHLGSYSCRNIYGEAAGPRSQHATADAFDVAGFVFADGRRISVRADWRKPDASARFLREVRDGACRYFDGVLSPDYNAAHADHFHLDSGPYRVCR